jgi:hypothetical protein
MSDELERLLGEWMTATSEGNLKNKIAEQIGELCADQKINELFSSRVKSALAIPRRGEEGVVILDLVYELEGGAIVLVESKFGTSQRGKLVQTMFAADDEVGAAQVLKVEDGITQLEGRWIRDRIAEIRKKDYLLADRLDATWKNFNLKVLEVRTEPEIAAGKARIRNILVTDETEGANRFLRGVPVQRTSRQQQSRAIAKKIAADKSAAESADRIAGDLRKQANDAAKKAEKLRETAAKQQRSAKATDHEDVRKRREQIAADSDKAATIAEEQAGQANEAAVKAEANASALAGTAGAADKKQIADAIKKADDLEGKARASAKKAQKAADDLAKAKAHHQAAKRKDSARRRGALAEDAEAFAKKAEEESKLARQAADQAKQELEALVGHDPRAVRAKAKGIPGTDSKSTDAKIVKGKQPPPAAETKAAQKAEDIATQQAATKTTEEAAAKSAAAKAAEDAAAKKATATLSKANTAKAVDDRATRSKGLATAKQLEKDLDSGRKSLQLAREGEEVLGKVGKARFVLQYAFKGGRMLAKVGKFIFTVMDVTGLNLLGDLLLVVDLVDAVCDWLQREKRAREREWKRIVDYLFGEPRIIYTDYGVPYLTSIRASVLSYIQSRLTNPADPQNFLFWLEKWRNEPAWDGFVYSQIELRMEKQDRRHADSDEAWAVKYRPPNALTVNLTADPGEDDFTETPIGIASTADDDNMTTQGKAGAYSMQFYDVDRSWLDIRFTQPIPCLTPFDFILVKCRMLSSALIGFLAKYDPLVSKDIDELIGEEFIDRFMDQDVFKNHRFDTPLNDSVIHTSVAFLFRVIKWFSQHGVQGTDFAPYKDNPRYNAGLFRRQQLLSQMYRPPTGGGPPFVQLAQNLSRVVERESQADLLKPVDPELKELNTQYLYDMATGIYRDLERAFDDTRKRPYVYQYKGPQKQPASAARR